MTSLPIRAAALLAIGLSSLPVPPALGHEPAMQAVRAHPFLFVSDHRFNHAEATRFELLQLNQRLAEELGTPALAVPVRVYLFKDFRRYQDFILHYLPYLDRDDTMRHGLFLLRNQVPHIFAYCSDDLQATLRHEFVHVHLNTACPGIPVWLDEALACAYQEGRPGHGSAELAAMLDREIRRGWRPDLRRLEQMKTMQHLGSLDYAEAWSWAHLLLNGPVEGRTALRKYLSKLAAGSKPGSLAKDLESRLGDLSRCWLNHFGYQAATGMPGTRFGRFFTRAQSWFTASPDDSAKSGDH